jgi:hypothetical protein
MGHPFGYGLPSLLHDLYSEVPFLVETAHSALRRRPGIPFPDSTCALFDYAGGGCLTESHVCFQITAR